MLRITFTSSTRTANEHIWNSTVHYTPRSYDSPTISLEKSKFSSSIPGTTLSTSRMSKFHSIHMLWRHRAIYISMQLGWMASPLSEGGTVEKVAAYLTKKTVSLQNDSSQLGPGTTSAHRGSRWWGRVTLRVKRNSRSAAVARVSSRMTQEEVKSGVNLTARGIFMNFDGFNFRHRTE